MLEHAHKLDETAGEDFSLVVVGDLNISDQAHSDFELLLEHADTLLSLMTRGRWCSHLDDLVVQ